VPGYYTLILHTHLPYVLNHGKWPHGSDWLSEAAAECYIPLLQMLDRLTTSGTRTRLSMDFSPVNLEQLADPAFIDVFSAYCDEKILAAKNDARYFSQNGEDHLIPMAEYWHEFYSNTRRLFLEEYNGNLVTGFRKFAQAGILDAMTCGATHGYFPLLLDDRNIKAQLYVAVETHERHFGMRPKGIWLPECAYRPAYAWKPAVGPNDIRNRDAKMRKGIEDFLPQLGLKYFVVDAHLIIGGTTVPSYHPFVTEHLTEADNILELEPEQVNPMLRADVRPDRSLLELYAVNSGTGKTPINAPIAFARDGKTAAQVWSAELGYPGSGEYLEFHKKHHNSGLRYWAVTGPKVDLGDKVPYDRSLIQAKVAAHADHFCGLIAEQLKEYSATHSNPGILSSPFDTELFGHWWFEGPRFLELVIEKLDKSKDIKITNCAEAIAIKSLPHPAIALPEGSWGLDGTHKVWMNKRVAWMWEIVYPLEDRFLKTLDFAKTSFGGVSEEKLHPALFLLLQQAGRELLLLEASDWEFLITTESASDYSKERFMAHANALRMLLETIDEYLAGHGIDEGESAFLDEIAMTDRVFPDLSLEAWG